MLIISQGKELPTQGIIVKKKPSKVTILKTTLVIPTYNEAENLPKLLAALFALPLNDLHVLVVDDNSPDGTGQIAEEHKKTYPGRIKVFELSRSSSL